MTTLTDTQQDIWRDRYARKDSAGKTIERDITDTWERVAYAIGDSEPDRESFFDLLKDFKFVPGGRILAGAGAESDKTFYNCYVIPVETKARRANRMPANVLEANFGEDEHLEWRIPPLQDDPGNDSREAIFDTIGLMVSIMSRGGGVGINWSTLRPKGSYLTKVSGTSSGPVGWMHVASTAVGEVEQGGSRRGAAMFMLDIWHPDVLGFIDAKRTWGRITNANVSVGVTDEFMAALSAGEDWHFIFPDTTHPDYDEAWDGDIKSWLDSGRPVVDYGSRPSAEIWASISNAAHASGEPGVIFLDRYNELSTANGVERIICVNPCGEQGLGSYSVCNLGAMNLYAYIKDVNLPIIDPTFPARVIGERQTKDFDWISFRQDVRTAIRFLDNVIDKTPASFLPETEERQRDLRRIGLGVMGLADALVALGLRYGGPESVGFVESVFQAMKDEAIVASAFLAKEKGEARGWRDWMWDRPYLAEFRKRAQWSSDLRGFVAGRRLPLRNLFLLTQAPTGTTSLLAGVNSGIEPYFNLKTWREDRTGGRYVYAKAVQDIIDASFVGVVPEDSGSYIITSKEVDVEEHIAIQAAVQKYVDSSVSKTVNAPSEQTPEETAKVFSLAYDSGLKGIAYYRDGSRDVQVLYHENPNEKISRLERQIEALKAENDSLKTPQVLVDGSPVEYTVTWDPKAGVSDFKLNTCPACEIGEVVREEGCMICHSCGWSAC